MGKLFKVVDVFQLKDRLVLMTDAVDQPREHKHGDLVELHRPAGKVIRTESWCEFHSFSSPQEKAPPVCIGISPTLTKTDVPIGTEVWTVTEGNSEKAAIKIAPVADLRNDESGRLDASKIADVFGLTMTEVAGCVGRPRTTVLKTPDSTSIQSKLQHFERIVVF